MISDSGGSGSSSGRNGSGLKPPTEFQIHSVRINLSDPAVETATVPCEDLEDALGGIARGFKVLEDCPVDDAYSPEATLLLNLGILSGTDLMTGLRTFFHAYSPLKTSLAGRPSAMWSAGSGKFGTRLKQLGIDEIHFTGRCASPSLLRIHRDGDDAPVQFSFEDASEYSGLMVNDRIQKLHARFPDAHFAVIGPAGENYNAVRYASIALSTENQLRSGDNKPRFCGRGGMGGVMGSKNLLAIVADVKDRRGAKAPPELKSLNLEVARGKGSAKFRDKTKFNGHGGTWANYDAMQPSHALPEMNFVPTGTQVSVPLFRDNFEQGPYVVRDESCYRCGISCHKNVYDETDDGRAGTFRAKLDFEPLNLLSSNIGIFNPDQCLELCEIVDQMCMDSISAGTSLSYVMEYNRRHPDAPIAGGLKYGDYEGAKRVLTEIGLGRLSQVGQGVMRLSRELNETGYAMHSKGVEYPAYLPQTNPGYPWALAGGHMSMRTYLTLLVERETSLDFWVDTITSARPTRGLSILRDDLLGACKFCGLSDEDVVRAVQVLTGLDLSVEDLQNTIRRVFLRGYRLEKRQGFTDDDYVMPAESHDEYPQIDLPYFNTPEFFSELRKRVTQRFDELLAAEGLA